MDEVRTGRDGPVFTVTIDRPARRNAIDGRTAEALAAALDAFEADDSARVLVLAGAGGVFCAGADLTALDTLAPRIHGDDGPLGFTRRACSKPSIAAIDGWAVAGGLELALWCDLRIATPDAQFGCLERRWGVPLVDGGTWQLPRIVGLGRALDLVLTGRLADAAEAAAIGLITRVATDPLAVAVELGHTIAGYPQPTMLVDRASIYAGLGLGQQEALAAEASNGAQVVRDGVAGATRFAAGAGRGGTPA